MMLMSTQKGIIMSKILFFLPKKKKLFNDLKSLMFFQYAKTWLVIDYTQLRNIKERNANMINLKSINKVVLAVGSLLGYNVWTWTSWLSTICLNILHVIISLENVDSDRSYALLVDFCRSHGRSVESGVAGLIDFSLRI